MIQRIWGSLRISLITTTIATGLVTASSAYAQSTDAETLRQLQRLIQQQQEQMLRQQRALQQLQQQVQALRQQGALQSLQQQVRKLQSDADKEQLEAAAAEARAAAEAAKAAQEQAAAASKDAREFVGSLPTPDDSDRFVTSSNEKVSLAISGQVNRMVNLADDGESTKAYHVDNDNSSTRFRLVARANVTEDFTIGSDLEIEIESNSSGDVAQDNEDTGTATFKDRILEVDFLHKKYGDLRIGQGWTASDSASQVDLSGTSVITYSSVADQAGGLKFRDDNGVLLGTRIKDVFSDFDGLGRLDRVRYDTPKFFGVSLAGSVASRDRWDVAARWAGKGHGLEIAAAGAFSNPQNDASHQMNGSFSVLHTDTGLSFTASGGGRSINSRKDPYSVYFKAGWETDFFQFGSTAFSAEFSFNKNVGVDRDEATAVGAAIVQNVKDYGAQLYGAVRNYDLDRTNQSTQDITVGTVGTRVKF